ncbi:ParB N-terminal domain-containing protein (plasmid) [Xanthomonas citri pv. citri]|uniref:ParB/RepB/Spo0J family partition protein n=1 Tax=Xanthomonas citri TaxID=346 RepID=UPI001931D064|nr:ParB N-terminal domain-containing protein [Xanthomonas citri]QRD62642.1 ParB N-terminal domain-containing protein [Xanthomonas citri pv. citri]QRD67177.1 ParB N-terminal domain-containing protein [Xanthomonas citri pv. citri]QRD71778.1 ParB N-terminal domain-containing protein [Xanthomonas citri pv. citri]
MSIGKAARFASPTAATANIGRMIENAASTNTQVITEIPVSKILPDPKNNRRVQLAWDNPSQIDEQGPHTDELKEELARIEEIGRTIGNPRIGQINPIVVVRRGEHFHLIAGHRRVLACKLVGKSTVSAVIRTDVAIRLLQFVENVQRKNIDMGEGLAGMLEIMADMGVAIVPGMEPGNIVKALINECGIAQASAYRWAGLLTAPPVLHDAVRDRVVRTWAQVEALVRLPEDEMTDEIAMLSVEVDSSLMSTQPAETGQVANQAGRTPPAKAGRRQKDFVTLGKVRNPHVIKTVIERVLGAAPEGVNWSDLKAVEKAFKKMLDQLSETVK